MRSAVLAALALAAIPAAPALAQSAAGCGELVTIDTHGRSKTSYALAQPKGTAAGDRIALVLLVGRGGYLNLGGSGCPRALVGNFLVRAIPHFHGAGLVTALVDAPSDYPGEDGLRGFRTSPQHADDLGKLIADVRKRIGLPVWVVGTSRGTISAVNAAARLTGQAAPDGVVLTSAIMSGGKGGLRPWAVQTVFDLRLEAIRVPVLVAGHAADMCPRTPATLMGRITARTNGAREQVVTVTGGPGSARRGLDACVGRTPHGFVRQEPAVAAGIGRFVRGGQY